MKKIFRILVIIIITLVVLSLTLSPIFAQENTQTPKNLQPSSKEVANKIDELVELKDDSALSDQDKEIKEIQIRKEALGKITSLSLLEIKNLKDKINSLDFESDAQTAIKERFLEILDNNKKYSEELKIKTENEKITLEEVKNLAQEYKDWREDNYNNYVKKLTVFILAFQEKNVLKTANTRLEKIMTDLKKLETAKIIKKEDTWKYIDSAMKSLTNAQIFNSNAEKIIISVIEKDIINIATSTPASASAFATSTSELIETATTTPEKIEKIMIKSTVEKSIASSTSKLATSTPTIKIVLEEDNAQTLIEKSLKEIKNAYNNFISISAKVSQKLKIK
ncbi:MAG: hypothetical protein AAB626_02790 [Patescibacteria group bacterium]